MSLQIAYNAGFINTAIIPILTTFNFKYIDFVRWIPIEMNFTDMDEEWYLVVGS
jgi:hypothetical protein